MGDKAKGTGGPAPIGVATMSDSGEIRLMLRAEGGGAAGDALLVYPKGHPKYQEILRHLGGLVPGESKPVPPWQAAAGAESGLLYRRAAWAAPPLMGAAGVFLAFSILHLIRLVQRSALFSVPLAAEQTVEFSAPGRVTLSVEGPRGTTVFARTTMELVSADSGSQVPLEPVFFRMKTSGFSTAKLEISRADIPRAGRYVLRVRGLPADASAPAGHRVAFGRPIGLPAAGWILAIILSAAALIAGTVFLALRAAAGSAP